MPLAIGMLIAALVPGAALAGGPDKQVTAPGAAASGLCSSSADFPDVEVPWQASDFTNDFC